MRALTIAAALLGVLALSGCHYGHGGGYGGGYSYYDGGHRHRGYDRGYDRGRRGGHHGYHRGGGYTHGGAAYPGGPISE